MSSRRLLLYPRIKCPYCKFYTTGPQALGIHLVDKHADKVVRGHVKIRTYSKTRQQKAKK